MVHPSPAHPDLNKRVYYFDNKQLFVFMFPSILVEEGHAAAAVPSARRGKGATIMWPRTVRSAIARGRLASVRNSRTFLRVAGLVAFAAMATVVAVGAGREATSDLVVHEWGTFLAMQGSDGATLDGMYHEEHALPGFVHARSRDQLRLPTAQLKGETPVIYFYSNRPQSVQVTVDFPTGIWTQWYPQANTVRPGLSTATSPASIGQPRNGQISWSAEVVPPTMGRDAAILPATADGALWNYARDVDACYVKTTNFALEDETREFERYIFYRGLGHGRLPLVATAANGGTLTASASLTAPIQHLFVVRIENGKGSMKYLPSLAPNQSITGIVPGMSEAVPVAEMSNRLADQLAGRLVESGLFAKEARAMVNTWKSSYFHSSGIRILFVLPQVWTDRFIPMRIVPQPRQIVRVMVGRVEMLTPEREGEVTQSVRDLASADAKLRERAFTQLKEQGRMVEPAIRRVLAASSDDRTRSLCRRLLASDFVTELRAATNAPLDGARIIEKPTDVRAQLALLLHDIGEEAEARLVAKSVLTELRITPQPALDKHEARHHLRSYARAYEAMGDSKAASDWYTKFIRFGAQVQSRHDACVGCHNGYDGPRDITWFADWWAGRRFADLQRRSGNAPQLIDALQAALAREPNDTANQLMLGYLRHADASKLASTVTRRD